ncbi:atypical protein kinase C isoform X2 [Aphis craccivora]|uniref:Atypical protein kinase C isoform X2 n=1 Tax=Aphis craccivora TaxID=307492 RepID=A0A6G0ZC32_APHCR|nr:atypical protein kinase C isoform X2 [Aphis craccivora]
MFALLIEMENNTIVGRMPTVDVPEIRVKTAFNGEVMITYIDPKITVDQLRYEMMVICRFSSDQDFTMKWVDEEDVFKLESVVPKLSQPRSLFLRGNFSWSPEEIFNIIALNSL